MRQAVLNDPSRRRDCRLAGIGFEGPNGRERVGGLLVLPRVQEDGWLSGGSLVRPSPQNLMMMSEAMVNWEALLPPA